MQILKNTGPTTITKTWYVGGVPTDPGTWTVGAVDLDGNTIIASGTAVDTDNGDGTAEHSLPIQTEVKEIDFTWTIGSESQTDRLSVVGDWLYTIADLRAFHSSDLASTSTYPTVDLANVREEVTAEFEEICGVSFIPKWGQTQRPGNGTREIEIPGVKAQEVLAVAISGSSKTAADFEPNETGTAVYAKQTVFSHPTDSRPRNVTISYRHGYDSVPNDIRRAALIVSHQRAKKDVTGAGIPYSASAFNDATGQYVTYGANSMKERWYGIPEVDNTLRRYRLLPGAF